MQLTFENNNIVDVDGICQVFSSLRNYEKLEGINFRCNNFNDRVIESLCQGIKMKKELRVIRYIFHCCCVIIPFHRQ